MMLSTLLACAALWTQNGPGTVRLEPGVRSLAQLARILSAQGVPARCDPSVSTRLALICVNERSWERLRPLLEKGLEVRFEQQPDRAWKIMPDPVALAREKILRERFAARYETALSDLVNRAWSAADEIARLDKPERDKRMKELDEVIRLSYAPGGTPADREFAVLMQSMVPSQHSANSRNAWLPARQPLGLASLFDTPAVREFTLSDILNKSEEARQLRLHLGVTTWANPIAGDAGGEAPGSAPAVAGAPDPMQVRISTRRVFDPLTFTLAENMDITEGNLFTQSGRALLGFGCTHFTGPDFAGHDLHLPFALRDIFRETGQEVALSRREGATTEWLNTPDKRLMLTLAVGERTLSAVAQNWSRESGNEIIMEVSPQRDILPGARAVFPDLALNMYRAMQSGQPLQSGEPSPNLPEPSTDSGRYLAATPFVNDTALPLNMRVWTAGQSDGVALVRNELAFLDNAATRNPDAALYLGSRRAQNSDRLPTLPDLLAASHLISPRDNAIDLRSSLYNGLGGFSMAYPLLRLLDTYPQREQVLKELAQNNAAYVEDRFLKIADITTFTETVRGLSRMLPAGQTQHSAVLFMSDFPMWTRQAVMVIKASPSELGKGMWVKFTLLYPQPKEAEKPQNYYPLWEAFVGPLAWPAQPASEDAKAKP